MPRHEHGTPTIARFKSLVEAGYTQAKAAKAVGVPRTTAIKWLKKDTDRRQPRPGRPPTLSDKDMDDMIEQRKDHFYQRIRSLEDQAQEHGHQVSASTLYRAWKRRGYQKRIPYVSPFISDDAAVKRKAWANEHKDLDVEYWSHAIWTDEVSFSTSTYRRHRVLRKSGERYDPPNIQFSFQSGRASFMAWGAIGWDFKSPLVILEKEEGQRGIGMTAYVRQVLREHLGPIFLKAQEDDPCVFIVEDNAPIHGKRTPTSAANRVRQEMDLYSIDWPPSSPDMNVIENVWRLIKQRLRNRKIHGTWTLPELRAAVLEEWDRLQPEDYRHWILEMKERVDELAAREGKQTRY